jgi:hypothetical protein
VSVAAERVYVSLPCKEGDHDDCEAPSSCHCGCHLPPRRNPRAVRLPGAGFAEREFPPSSRKAPCCAEHVDEIGRYPIGPCSATCVRRPAGWPDDYWDPRKEETWPTL